MVNIFDITKCPVPALPALTDSRILLDCSVPAAPQPIYQCPDIDFDVPTITAGAGLAGPPGVDGGDGPPGPDCFTVGGSDCAFWVWCPCGSASSSSVSGSLAPSGADVPGTWEFLSGDPSQNVPCWLGNFYGEVAIICPCPGDSVSISSSSSTPNG
jgi:hypothetical protein